MRQLLRDVKLLCSGPDLLSHADCRAPGMLFQLLLRSHPDLLHPGQHLLHSGQHLLYAGQRVRHDLLRTGTHMLPASVPLPTSDFQSPSLLLLI